jgi:hypothetical protein
MDGMILITSFYRDAKLAPVVGQNFPSIIKIASMSVDETAH